MKPILFLQVAGVMLVSSAVLAAEGDDKFAKFSDPQLMQGRKIWLDTCKNCHATGLADAPPVHDKQAWQPRLAKGRAVLQQHALQGFFGPQGTMMPARGGNDKLTDDEVKAAVDYMIAIVK